MTDASSAEPQGQLTIRTLAMPADTNPAGDIFGGWVMSQMDIAGAISAVERVKGRVVTVAVEAMTHRRPRQSDGRTVRLCRAGRGREEDRNPPGLSGPPLCLRDAVPHVGRAPADCLPRGYQFTLLPVE
jgi:hypothetical protein